MAPAFNQTLSKWPLNYGQNVIRACKINDFISWDQLVRKWLGKILTLKNNKIHSQRWDDILWFNISIFYSYDEFFIGL